MTTSGEFLLEARAEEIPARMLPAATRELATRLFEELMSRGLVPQAVETGFTPRRLVVVLRGLPPREPDREEDILGPPLQAAVRAGALTEAAAGFARRCDQPATELWVVATEGGRVSRRIGAVGGLLADIESGTLPAKGLYLSHRRQTIGRPTGEVLAELVPRVLAGVTWPKSMKWGVAEGPWVRPLHGVVALLDGAVVPFELFGVPAGNRTVGHPVLSPASFEVTDDAGYRRALAERGIEIEFERRKTRLREEMARIAAARGGRIAEDDALLDKLAAMCEIPGVLEGSLLPEHLGLPREVLQTSLRDHQSAFTVESAGGAAAEGGHEAPLLPLFLTVMDRPDDPSGRVRAGNEWVVAARLADARFFYAEDRRRPLAERREALERLTFHERLGSYAEKGRRIEALASKLAQAFGWPEVEADAREAAGLLKADLVTEMVKEFTSLQGVMGGIYAREDGARAEVWQAIYDQYRPAGTADELPRGRAGVVVAIADRLDSLAGLFSLGLIPSGSKDPFGLRRAAQGIARILLEKGLRLDLRRAGEWALAGFEGRAKRPADEVLEALSHFFRDRSRYLLGVEGFAHDEIEAALGAAPDDPADARARVRALKALRQDPAFLAVALAAKRIENILKAEIGAGGTYDLSLADSPAETELADGLESLRGAVERAFRDEDYDAALRAVAVLGPRLDRFFTDVLVMDKDPKVRANRLDLLRAIRAVLSRIARFSEIVGAAATPERVGEKSTANEKLKRGGDGAVN